MKPLIYVLALLAGTSLSAAAWKLEVQGSRALGSGYAGGLVDDASTVWFNPAGMTLLDGSTITAGAPVIDLSIQYHDNVSTSLLGQPMRCSYGWIRPALASISAEKRTTH